MQGTSSARWTNSSGKQHFQKRLRHGAANASVNEKEASLLANIIIVGAGKVGSTLAAYLAIEEQWQQPKHHLRGAQYSA